MAHQTISCAGCGAQLLQAAPEGLCAKCLLRRGLDLLVRPAAPSSADAPTEASVPLTPFTGTKLRYFGDYELLEEIARGGMGVVFKARQVSLNRLVALKLISAGALATPELVKRFKAEAEAAASLSHPNIVPIHEIGEHQGQHYFSMGLIDGPNLREVFEGRTRSPHAGFNSNPAPQPLASVCKPKAAAQLLTTIARALQYAHQRGVLHRDIKPSNILLDPAGQPHLTDFGLAKLIEKESTLTQTNAVLGTPAYMSPEQARGDTKAVTTAADVYGLGAVLYETLTGTPPFSGGTSMETIRQVLEQEPRRPSIFNPNVDRDLETICLKCLEKEPDRRYKSAEAFAEDLDRWMASEPIAARPVGQLERMKKWVRRRPAIALLSATSLLLFVGLLASGLLYTLRERARSAALKRNVASQYLQKGRALCEQGETTRGLHWFIRAWAELPPENVALEKDIRQSLAKWAALSELPQAIVPLSEGGAAIALSPDGKTAVTAGGDGLIRLWSAESGEALSISMRHEGVVNVSISADGRTIVTVGQGVARVWSVEDGEPRGKSVEHPNANRASLSLDGARLLTYSHANSEETSVRIWDSRTGELIGKPMRHDSEHGRIWHADFSPDGHRVLTASGDKTARLWNADTGSQIGSEMRHQNEVVVVAFSPDGKLALSGSQDWTARLWNAINGEPVGEPMLHANHVEIVAFSPDGTRILTGSVDGTARLWHGHTGKPIFPEAGSDTPPVNSFAHGSPVMAAGFSAAGDWLFTAGSDRKLRLWSISTGHNFGKAMHHEQGIHAVEVRGNTAFVQSGSQGILWRIQRDAPVEPVVLRRNVSYGPLTPEALAFFPDGKSLLMGDHQGSNWWWEIDTGRVELAIPHQNGREWSVEFDASGRLLLSAGADRVARLWSLETGSILHSFEHRSSIGTAVFNSDGNLVATGSGDQTAAIWSAETGQRVGPWLSHPARVEALCFSPDGKLLLTAAGDGFARLWSVKTGRQISSIEHGGALLCIAISGDGQLLATGGSDKAVRLWHVSTGQSAGPVLEHRGVVVDLAFSPDGQLLATASSGGDDRVRLWSAATGELVAPTLPVCCGLSDISFSRDGARLAIAGYDVAPTLWQVGPPFQGSLRDARIWVEAVTWHEVNQEGVLSPLKLQAWQERRQRR